MSSSRKGKKESWKNQERHYCALCNIWTGGDRQSIMLHENGKKHREKVEESLEQKRRDKMEEDKQNKFLQSTLAQIEAAARGKMGMPTTAQQQGGGPVFARGHQQHPSHAAQSRQQQSYPQPMHQPSSGAGMHGQNNRAIPPPPPPSNSNVVPPPPPPPPPATTNGAATSEQAREAWQARREKRKEKDDDDDDDDDNQAGRSKKRIRIEPGQGHYDQDGKTYLEGQYFFAILEEDLPVQLWTGGTSAGDEEKRLPERSNHWKDALVAAVHHNKNTDELIVHVSYLQSTDDTDETLAKSVALDRIRLVLGGDERIPDNLHEARLLAMGGEELELDQAPQQEVEESTGLTGWSTVTIKRTTVRQELKEGRDRLRKKRKEASDDIDKQKKEADYRRMEEAKTANADDSALGAYDVWNTGGYKGIDIQKEADIKVEDTAKSLSAGKSNVAFKKKRKPIKKNRRRTTADD